MSIENIVDKIIDEAKTTVLSIKEKSDRDVSKLASELDSQEKEIRQEYRKRIDTEAEEIVKRRISSARLEGRKRILGQKDMIVGEVYAEAKRRILALPEEKYLDFLKSLAVSHSVGGDEKVMLSKNDLSRLKAKLPQWEKDVAQETKKLGKTGTIAVSSDTRDIEGGLVLSQGRTEINLSIDVILNETKYLLETEVTQVLFGP